MGWGIISLDFKRINFDFMRIIGLDFRGINIDFTRRICSLDFMKGWVVLISGGYYKVAWLHHLQVTHS